MRRAVRRILVAVTFSVTKRLGLKPSWRLLHVMADPWDNARPAEQTRYRATNELLTKAFGHINSILEIGSGEGYQTAHLVKVAHEVVGLEYAAIAVGRASSRVPGARFVLGSANDLSRLHGRTFDVVIAAEVLFYADNVPDALAQMERHATRGCVVSTIAKESPKVMPHVLRRPGVETTTFTAEGCTWDVAWWVPAGAGAAAARGAGLDAAAGKGEQASL